MISCQYHQFNDMINILLWASKYIYSLHHPSLCNWTCSKSEETHGGRASLRYTISSYWNKQHILSWHIDIFNVQNWNSDLPHEFKICIKKEIQRFLIKKWIITTAVAISYLWSRVLYPLIVNHFYSNLRVQYTVIYNIRRVRTAHWACLLPMV